jgi:hypothetical protein
MENAEEQGAAELGQAPSKKDINVEAVPSKSVIEARMERLLRMLLWVGDPDVARSLRRLSVADLNLQSLTIRTALQALKRKRDPTTFLAQSQYRPTVPLVAEVVSEACQEAVVSALGEAADHPDRAQLLRALEEVRDRFPESTVALTLSYVSVTDMVAADLCDEILESEEQFQVPASVAVSDIEESH